MFSDHGCLRFLIEYISDLYSALLIWFLITESTVHDLSNFQYFASKVRQPHRGEFKFG